MQFSLPLNSVPPTATPLLSTELLAHYRHITSQPLTVVDVETTGSKSTRDRVIEISLLQADLDSGIHHQQTHLIDPGVAVPARIADFTGIDTKMLQGSPSPADIWPQYLPLLSQGILTAHNIRFDHAFITAELDRQAIAFVRPPQSQCCTVQLSRLLLSHLPSRRLPALVQHFQFPVDTSHRAEADTLACWLLAERLLTEIQSESDEALLEKFSTQTLSLSAAVAVLRCSTTRALQAFEAASVRPLYTSKRGIPYYQRRFVEQVYWQLREVS
ncbi:MAG: 3'-5' exonuclease [Cyanobacteria bacterium P01_E01_bin.34]